MTFGPTLRPRAAALETARTLFSLRSIKYFLCWLMLWQDAMITGGYTQISNWGVIFPGLTSIELIAVAFAVVLGIERTLTGDFTIRRSYFGPPLALMFWAYVASWLVSCFMRQHYSVIMEAHEGFEWPVLFFLVHNAFRDEEDREVLWKIIVLAVLPKCVEGVQIYFLSADDHKNWGVVQLWRDGFLLGIGAISTMLLLNYEGTSLKRLRTIVLAGGPFLGFTFIMSYRRTFMVGAAVCMMAMFFTLPRGRRKRHIAISLSFVALLLVFIFSINPVGVLGRLSGIVDPSGEGSAYIRLMELPNVLRNIRAHPIIGVPVGIPWKVYYRMPISAVYTTLGTHDSYLYWPLRLGIAGLVVFPWFMGRMWKVAVLNYRCHKTEEDSFYGHFGVQLLLLYHVACFFGLMYADGMPAMIAVMATVFQLQARYLFGRTDFSDVAFWASFREKRIIVAQELRPETQAPDRSAPEWRPAP